MPHPVSSHIKPRTRGVFMLMAACGISAFVGAADNVPSIPIDAESHQIKGDRGEQYETVFSAAKNDTESALIFEQKLEQTGWGRYWKVVINGTELGRLEAHVHQVGTGKPYDGFHRIGLAVPPGVLKDGQNRLEVKGQGQEAVVRKFELANCSLKEALELGTVRVTVHAGEDSRPLPARITIVDNRGQLAKLYDVRTPTNAVRPGLLYTLGTGDTFSLPAGRYTLYATRGMEWGVARLPIVVDGGQSQSHPLTISREVNTTGFVACDSHIHTLPGSGHGNATFPERMITISGEGVEVAIATDHNHISDYLPHQHVSGTQDHFHAISGDEVTCPNGHFTAFPLDPAKAVPGGVQGRNPLFLESRDWIALIADMREKGAKVVILNHPYWPSIAEGPFGQFRFDRRTGGRLMGPEFNFDGLEVAQPANAIPDSFYAFDDWLTLLNRGIRLTAVGATDSHTVNSPVGQARTYLQSSTDDVTQIQREEIYRAFVEGRASVAAGIFATLHVGREYTMGDLVPATKVAALEGGRRLSLQLRVAAPSWVHPRRAMIYVNGRRVADRAVGSSSGNATEETLNFSIDVPPYDAHVVAMVLGDDIELPGWTTYGKATQAITNPIYLDVDGDQKYSSPRQTAAQLIAQYAGATRKALLASNAIQADPAVYLHVKDLFKP